MAEKEKLFGASHPQLLPYYFFLAQLHDAAGSYPEEIPLFRKAVAVCEQAYGRESICAGLMLTSLGAAQSKTADYTGAGAALRHAQAICDKVAGLEAPFSGTLLNALSEVLLYTGRYGEADGVLSRALAVNKKSFG